MKTHVCLLLVSMLYYRTSFSQSKESENANPYSIAYNIHEKDTIHKSNYEIITMNMDGSGKKNITNHTDVAWTYYAFKKRLFFISDRDTCFRCFFLYETDVNGSSLKKVSELMLEDSWMSGRHNGEELVVTGRTGKNIRHQLFILNSNTGEYNQLTNDTSAKFGDPCFSPDGKQIVFYYKKNKRDKMSHEELFLMNADGSNMKQLTYYPENNPSAKDYGYRAGAARWHPSENFITYVSLQNGRHSIFAITPDSKKQWKLLENAASEDYHDWSPDGKWLTYSKSDINGAQSHIMLMNWKTKEEKQLTDTTYKSQLSPVFLER